MDLKKTKYLVGLFVASGTSLALLIFIWLGMSQFFQKGQYYLTYFDESVQGLDIDAPVKYRGVSIGRVKKIEIAPDLKLIQVLLQIETAKELNNDITAQIKSVGITGSMYIELDQKKPDEKDLSPALSFSPQYPVITSKPSSSRDLIKGIDQLLSQMNAIDIPGISFKIKSSLDTINTLVADFHVKDISFKINTSLDTINRIADKEKWDIIISSLEHAGQSLNMTIAKANNLLTHLENVVSDNEMSISSSIDNFRQSMENVRILSQKSSLLINTADMTISELRTRLITITQNLETGSESLNQLLDLLNDQPSQLLFAEPPPPKKVKPDHIQ